ncbi:MAG: PadR family transcriptional regulator [Erysipelotrichales bacterium]|nr:PadR family transcriptional regulator [Erysipelotrichales bacterium]
MDAQMKKGLLDVCVLALLSRGDSYGYELISKISTVIDVSESTLYPILKRLESVGQLVTYSREYNGRLRRYYRITPEGKRRLKDFDEEWQEMQRINEFVHTGDKR